MNRSVIYRSTKSSFELTVLSLVLLLVFYFLSFLSYASEELELDEQSWNFTVSINGEANDYRIPKAEMKRQTIDINGRSLHFFEVYRDRERGPKPLVIFIHGTPGGWSDQAAFLGSEIMRDNFHMIALDRLGHGRSEGKIVSSLQAQAASLKPLLERDTSGNGAILVGHSMGGAIIARTAMDYPKNISGLVFIASTGDPKRSRRWYNTVAAFPPIRWLLPRQLARSNREILPLKKELKAMLPLWQNIKVPTTIIQGSRDKLVDPKNADFIQQALVNTEATMIIYPDADHFIHWQQPQIIIDVLAKFITQ